MSPWELQHRTLAWAAMCRCLRAFAGHMATTPSTQAWASPAPDAAPTSLGFTAAGINASYLHPCPMKMYCWSQQMHSALPVKSGLAFKITISSSTAATVQASRCTPTPVLLSSGKRTGLVTKIICPHQPWLCLAHTWPYLPCMCPVCRSCGQHVHRLLYRPGFMMPGCLPSSTITACSGGQADKTHRGNHVHCLPHARTGMVSRVSSSPLSSACAGCGQEVEDQVVLGAAPQSGPQSKQLCRTAILPARGTPANYTERCVR